MRPSWFPVVVSTNAAPLPAFMDAPVVYGLPVTWVPKTNPLALLAIEVKLGHPLEPIVAL
jgi:hypothetical protein